MGLIASAEKKREPINDGVYHSVCIGVIDIGTHYDEKFGKSSHKALLMWEIPELLIKFEKDGVEKEAPRVISKKYTLSLGEKANLRKDLQSWRGRAFTDEELRSFDLLNVLGKNCMLQIINTTKDGRTYSNIASVMPLYKGVDILKPVAEPLYFSLSDGVDIPISIPAWIRDIITKSQEYQDRVSTTDHVEPPVDDAPPF